MPTTISNAVETQQQFSPKPDATYQGQYKGISGVTYQSSGATRDMELSQSMLRLNDALSGYMVNHEKYKDEMGHIQAERMINSESPQDILKLNALDAAQQYGYADATANPYFQAYAEKMRGGFAAARMKQDYDQTYSMAPAKSLAEESQRYNKFASDWKANNLSGNNAPGNPVAFNDGYDESQLVNVNTLATDWVKTKHKEDIIDTVASTKSKLGQLIVNSKEILSKNGAMTSMVQSVMNEYRLMGVPLEYRMQIMENFAQELLTTGHMDGKRFEQMAQKIVVQTGMDGTKTTLDKVLDMQTYKTMAAKYNAEYNYTEKFKWADAMIAKGDIKFAAQDIDASDPETRMWKKPMLGYVQSKIEEAKRKKEANLKASLKKSLKAGGGKSDANKLVSAADMNTLMDAWVENNADHWNDTPITQFKVDDKTFNEVYMARLKEYIKNGDTDKFYRLMDMPQGKDHMESVKRNIESMFNLLHQTPDDKSYQWATNIDSLPELNNLITMLASDPQRLTARLGSSLGAKATVLSDLLTMYGFDNRDAAIWHFAGYINAKQEDKDAFEQSFDNGGYIDKGIDGISRMNSNGSVTDGMVLSSETNQNWVSYAKDLYVAQRCIGNNAENAWNAVVDTLKNNFYAYHNGIYPKALANNMGTEDDDLYFTKGMETGIYTAAGDTDGDRVDLQYNPNTQTFMFRSILSGGVSYMTVNEIREAGKEKYKNDVEEAEKQKQQQAENNTTMTADDFNDARDAEDEAEDTTETYKQEEEDFQNPEAPAIDIPGKVASAAEYLWNKWKNG